MEIPNSQETYLAGLNRREREEPDLTVTPNQAADTLIAREEAVRGYAASYGDSISVALEDVRRSGRTASFLEFYKGPLSDTVLAQLLEANKAPA